MGNEVATTEKKAPEKKPELVTGGRVMPIVPRNVDEVFRVAQAVLQAGLVPDSYGKDTDNPKDVVQKVVIGIMKGSEVGFPPITALSTIAIINKRPCIWGDGAMALAHRSGKVGGVKEWFAGTEGEDDWTAHCEIKRRDQDEPIRRQFSVKDAKRAHLWGNQKRQPWILYPQRMLAARARSWALRDAFADVLMGLSIAEEAQDMPMRDVTPPKTDFLEDDEPTAAEGTDSLPAPDDQNPVAGEGEAQDEPEIAYPIIDETGDYSPPLGPDAWAEEFKRLWEEAIVTDARQELVEANTPYAAAFNEKGYKAPLTMIAFCEEKIEGGEGADERQAELV